MVWLFYTTNISVDLAHHDIFHAKDGKGGIIYEIACIFISFNRYEPVHEISNNVACVTSKASDQPAHTRSLIRAFASCLSIL